MRLPLVQIDAFADRPFEGNPAAVVRLDDWPDDALMQAIAAENNLSETAFVVRTGDRYGLRWFTPTVEVDLCGHATLAAGWLILRDDGGDHVVFDSRSGELVVARAGDRLEMALPSIPPRAAEPPPGLVDALGHAPVEVLGIRALHHAAYWLAVYPDEATIRALAPDVGALRALRSNVICTAPDSGSLDFVSRFFAPGSGVDEDPVTGSAHCTLAPFWAERLDRNPLQARQLSRRGGSLEVEVRGDRVLLRGRCALYLEGTIAV